jgi:hypothetical protein
MSKLSYLIRKNKGLKVKEYLIDLIRSCQINFQDSNLLNLEESDEIVSMVKKRFAGKDKIDELVSYQFKGQIQEIELLQNLSKRFFNVGGYFLSDVYEYCGIYKEKFSDLIEKSQCLLLKSEQDTVMITDENFTVYVTINLIEEDHSYIEIQVKYFSAQLG